MVQKVAGSNSRLDSQPLKNLSLATHLYKFKGSAKTGVVKHVGKKCLVAK